MLNRKILFYVLISEFTHVMLKVYVKLAALSAEWPGHFNFNFINKIRVKSSYAALNVLFYNT